MTNITIYDTEAEHLNEAAVEIGNGIVLEVSEEQNMEKINIQTLENGDTFTRYGCGTNSHYHEISKEEYERVTAFENYRGRLNVEYEETMDDCIRWGYGFYGCRVCKDDEKNKHYFVVTIGNSCD